MIIIEFVVDADNNHTVTYDSRWSVEQKADRIDWFVPDWLEDSIEESNNNK
jgi:hypothetical protein